MNRPWLLTLSALMLGVAIGWWGASNGPLAPVFAQESGQAPAQDKPSAPAPTDPSESPVTPDKPDGGEQEVEATVVGEDQQEGTPLMTLDWLVGSWTEAPAEGQPEGSDGTRGVHFSCQFTNNNAFILRSFTVGKDDAMMSGMQIVAWDPALETIRSWTFDSNGGFGEAIWSQAGPRYTIRTKYTLPDGGIASSMNILTYVSEDAFTWRSVQREIDGELQPDVDEITLVRASEAESVVGEEEADEAGGEESAPGEPAESESADKEIQPSGAASKDSTGGKQ